MNGPSSRIVGLDRGPFAAAVIGGSVVLTGLSAQVPWWSTAVVGVLILSTVTVRRRGRTLARWLLDWSEFRRSRRRATIALNERPTVEDIQVAAGSCGIRTDGTTLISLIQLAPNLDLPTVIAEKTIYTEDTVSVNSLRSLLDHYGVAVAIDIVTTGQRVRPAGSYSMLYDQLIGPHPVVGNRLTWLVVRLDLERNLSLLSRRGRVAETGPKALASATHRIAGRLRERGVAAHALPGSAMLDAIRLLHAGFEPSELSETWNCLQTKVPGRFVSSYTIDWSMLGGASLDDCWTWTSGRTTVVVNLTSADQGPRALVRFVGPAVDSLPDYLRKLPGRQGMGLLASLPTARSLSDLPWDEKGKDIAPPEVTARLQLPIGPNGQILGAISGQHRHTLAMPLFDPARYQPRRRSIDVHATLPVAQQLVLRATVVGADVEVHTNRPEQWHQLVRSVGDPRSLRLADPNAQGPIGPDATIAVFDNVTPQVSPAPTTVAITDPGGPRRRSVDLSIDQVSATAITVSIPMRTVRVDLIEPRGETRYFTPAAPPPPPDSPPPDSAALPTHSLPRSVGRMHR